MIPSPNVQDAGIPSIIAALRRRLIPISYRGLGQVILFLAITALVGCTGVVSSSDNLHSDGINQRLHIATTALPTGTVQADYVATLAATGGAAPYAWSLTSGSLPMGLALNPSTGILNGTPKQTATGVPLTFEVTDSSSPPLSQTANLQLTVAPTQLAIITRTLASGQMGSPYQATLAAAGGTPPYKWSLLSGNLPSGLSLNGSTGGIAGNPQVITGAPLAVEVTDASIPVSRQTANLMLTVAPARLLIETTSLPSGQVAAGYSVTLDATGGVPPYFWSTSSGSLPPGLTLNPASGTIAGTTTSSGAFSFTAKVQDAKLSAASASFSVSVSTAPTPMISGVSPNSGSINGGISVTISGNNFRPEAQVQFGNVPAASVQVINATQIQALTPAESAGAVNVTIQNPDGQSSSAPKAFAFVSPPAPTSSSVSVTADVVVDASQIVSQTGHDDLSAAKNIYASASSPESNGGLYPDWSLISSEFPMKRMRDINGLGDCALDNNGNLIGCTRLDNDLQNIQQFNLTPHVIVGQWAPSFIGGNPLQWGTAQWATYDALCYAIVNYVATQYGGSGFSEAFFEVENEMDTDTTPQDLWLTTTPTVPQGDPSRFTQFDTVYSHWAKAVTLVAQQNPSKKIRIGGPSTGFWTVYYGSGQLWHNQIIQKYAAEGIRLDVVTLHIYSGDASVLAKYAQSIRNTLIANGMGQAEIWVTEWGASSTADSSFGAINASNSGAAWAIYCLLQSLSGTVTGGSFLQVRDNYGTDVVGVNANMYEASWNHLENSIEYPKAVANAFSMVNLMTGTRKSVAVNPVKPDIYSLASSGSTSASVIVANYNYLFDWTGKNYSDQTKSGKRHSGIQESSVRWSGDGR